MSKALTVKFEESDIERIDRMVESLKITRKATRCGLIKAAFRYGLLHIEQCPELVDGVCLDGRKRH